jgi:hypothetical protein
MLRFVFAFIVFIHGLIHFMGFAKELKLAQVNGLTGKTLVPLTEGLSKGVGVLWLITCLLFLISAAAFLIRKEWWWMPGAIAVVLSQILIIIYWQDAKFGTILNVIVLVAIVLSYGTWSFNRMVKNELKTFLLTPKTNRKIVREEMLSGLPSVVKNWLRHSHVIGKELTQTVHLRQTGELKTSPKGKWLSVNAEQYFTVEQPGFVWIADVKAAPFIHLAARDKYQDGKGHMLIKMMSLFTVAEGKGKETDQGTLLRYLAEIIWFPSAAISNYIKWEEVDSLSARGTMHYGDMTASGIFNFSAEGDMISFEAQRYYDRREGATLETWLIKADEYNDFEGVRIPSGATVTWKFKTGDFKWLRLKITELKYNEVIKK